MIAGFQLIFSNGLQSPLFLADGTNANNLKSVDVAQDWPVTTIKGDSAKKWVKFIQFCGPDGRMLASMVAQQSNQGQSMELRNGEEIIGLYGHKTYKNCFSNLGFIAWKPKYN